MKNKYSLLLLVTSFGIISCQEKVEPIENEKTVVEDNVIVYEEYMGDEPTTPSCIFEISIRYPNSLRLKADL